MNLKLKRLLDIAGAVIGLLALSMPLLFVGILVCIISRVNPIFLQTRLGKDQKPFKVVKLRTLNEKKDRHGKLLPDELRSTKFGNLLRNFSVDELPQLINVLFGTMSLVGPRPLLAEYGGKYTAYENQRHIMKPGITGWVQVNGRDRLDWDAKFKLDVWYVNNWSLKLDIKILWISAGHVISKKDTTPNNRITVERYDEI